jgi:hypothetical protein
LRSQTISLGLGLMLVTAALLTGLERKGSALSLDRRFPDSWTSQLWQGAQDFQQRSLLHNAVDEAGLVKTLTHANNGGELARPRLYVIGDSHSNHYVEALRNALPGWGVGSASIGWQCGYISALDINSQTRQWMKDCEKFSPCIDHF